MADKMLRPPAPYPVKPRDIQQFIRGRLVAAIKDILAQLVEAGEVEWSDDGYRTATK
jgi:hypothetical protein